MIIFLYGEDTYRSKQKLNNLKKKFLEKYGDMNISIYEDIFDISKIKNDLNSLSFLSDKRMIIIKDISKSKDKKILESIVEFLDNIPEEVVLVFWEEGAPDKRTAFYKKLEKEKYTEEFKFLENRDLNNWIIKKVGEEEGEIDPKTADILSGSIGNDLWQLETEIKKLVNFNKKITEENVKNLVQGKVDSNIFEMVDVLGKRNYEKAAKKMHDLLNNGEAEIYILTMIVRQFRILILVKDLINQGMRSDEIGRTIKMHPFVVRKAVDQSRNFDIETLKKVYGLLSETDFSIKRGVKEPKLALDLLVQKICS